MVHNLTGETIAVVLDGVPLALATGFSPQSWGGAMKQVELPDGRVVTVRDPEDLPVVAKSGKVDIDAAAAYGLGAQGLAFGSALVVPDITLHSVQVVDGETTISGGQAYDKGHFMGTEYRKRSALGSQVEAAGECYTVGARSQEMTDWSTARIDGLEPPPKGGVAAGRTLVRAVGILSEGEVVRTGDGRIQVYDQDRRKLLAVYDPSTNSAGDTFGNTNASAEQMAAVIAHRALQPQNQYDLALSTDLARVQQGSGTPLAAADSAYITMKNSVLADGGTITLGAKVGARKCPNCGQFMGAVHNCPVTSTPAPAEAASIDFSGLGAEIAAALKDQTSSPQSSPQDVNVSIDAEPFAQALREALSEISPASQAAVETTDMTELRDAMTEMAQAVETLSQRPVAASGGGEIAGAETFATAVDRLAGAVQGIPAGGTVPLQEAGGGKRRCPRCGQYAGEGHTCPPRPKRSVPERPKNLAETAQEHIFSPVELAAPDPFLDEVPQEVGGNRYQPLEEDIPQVDPNFEINEQTERIMRSISAMLQAGQGKEGSGWSRAFGLYGPAGTGKNTLARQLAASIRTVDEEGNETQGLNYVEANITPESSMQELIGTTVLEKDPESGTTVSRARLGKIGLAAAMGSVISINEIVRNPKLATALQSMMEDGEIQIDSPEQGLIRIPVHPSTVFVMTWNPGNEGDPDRPAAAPLSRIVPFRMDKPTIGEQADRVRAQIASIQGAGSASPVETRRKELRSRAYQIPKDWTPSDQEINAATRFINEVATLAEGGIGERQIGLNSDTSTAPGQRQLTRFVMLGKTAGWDHALDTLKIVCDQDSLYETQWKMIEERFRAHFGDDGGALDRAAPKEQ
jgi:MoxR-like ATPase